MELFEIKMDKSSKKTFFLFLSLIIISTIIYGIGMGMKISYISTAGFVGIFLSYISSCNWFYKKGYLRGLNK